MEVVGLTGTRLSDRGDPRSPPKLSSALSLISPKVGIAMNFKHFKPRDSVKILDKDPMSVATFLKTWALARLLGWSILDQRPGTKLRSRNARQVGHVVLAHLLDQRLAEPYAGSHNDELLELMIELFRECGGFSGGLRGPGERTLLRNAKKSVIELQYVYLIAEFMCRYRKYVPEGDKFQIESAKLFVEQNFLEGKYGASKISKIWEQYKHAAPYIFASYTVVRDLSRVKTVEEVVGCLKGLTSNQQRITRLIGVAAHAAHILAPQVRNTRVSDFKNITQIEPVLRKFSEEEQTCIRSIDRKVAIA